MQYEELHQRYGSHIARRVKVELTVTEFSLVDVDQLPLYLETRAELAHKQYQLQLANPFVSKTTKNVDVLYDRWRDAEDLAYLINIAEDVSATTRFVMANGHV